MTNTDLSYSPPTLTVPPARSPDPPPPAPLVRGRGRPRHGRGAASSALRRVGVVPLQRFQQRLVLRGAAGGRARRAVERDDEGGAGDQVLHEMRSAPAGRQGRQFAGGSRPTGEWRGSVAARQSVAFGREVRAQRPPRRRPADSRAASRMSAAFHDAAGMEDLASLLHARRRDVAPRLGRMVTSRSARSSAQGRAHDRAADAERGAEVIFATACVPGAGAAPRSRPAASGLPARSSSEAGRAASVLGEPRSGRCKPSVMSPACTSVPSPRPIPPDSWPLLSNNCTCRSTAGVRQAAHSLRTSYTIAARIVSNCLLIGQFPACWRHAGCGPGPFRRQVPGTSSNCLLARPFVSEVLCNGSDGVTGSATRTGQGDQALRRRRPPSTRST